MSGERCGCHKGKAVPNAIYVRDEDDLRVGVQTALSGLVIGVSGMMMNADGETSKFTVTVAPTSNRVETVVSNNIGSGWILHAQAHVISGTVTPRSVYVTARIVSNTGTPAVPMAMLFAGYLSDHPFPAYPTATEDGQLEQQGNLRSVTGTDPAAGSECSDTVPANARWRLISWRAALVTDANVATRQVHLVIDDGTLILANYPAGTTQIASLTRNYNGLDIGVVPALTDVEIYIPTNFPVLLAAGSRITTVTTSIQATDNYGAPQMLVEEYLVL